MTQPPYFGEERLRKYFLGHLNRICCAKSHLVERFPELSEIANFKDVRNAVIETMGDVENQIVRMHTIFTLLDSAPTHKNCDSMASLLEEAFEAVHELNDDVALRDMAILFYMQSIESIEMASYQVLRMAAVKFRNSKINQLLLINFDEAKEDRALMLLITAKYLAK
jgi:ferritin-like metal-binding protein YciE